MGTGAVNAAGRASFGVCSLLVEDRLLFPQPITTAMNFGPERRETSLIAPITRDPYENCGLAQYQSTNVCESERGYAEKQCRQPLR